MKNSRDMKPGPSLGRLKEALCYEPETGIFRWLTNSADNPYSGRRAGSVRNSGYRAIRLDYEIYQEHRLAFLYVFGRWPELHIDHVNGDKSDNRIANLREASRSENLANMGSHADSASGLKGVARHKRLGWFARICVNRKSYFLGYHPTAELAHQAYVQAAKRLRGQFARTM